MGSKLQFRLLLVVAAIFAFAAPSPAKDRRPQDCNPTSITANDIPNFHKVDDDLYRGARLRCSGYAKLDALGIRTFIDLGGAEAALRRCEAAGRDTKLRFGYVPFHINWVQTGFTGISDDSLRRLFLLIQTSPRPIFIGCRLGRDRTGLVAALYRMRRHEASFEEAKQEALSYGFNPRLAGTARTLNRYRDPHEVEMLPAPAHSGTRPEGVCRAGRSIVSAAAEAQ